MTDRIPPYFDQLIAHFNPATSLRHVHLGYWDDHARLPKDMGYKDFENAQIRLNDIMINLCDLHNDYKVLDVGCGLGATIERINEQYHNMQLTGLNVDNRQIAICKQLIEKNGNTFRWQLCDACNLPSQSNTYDRIFCIEAMFHFHSRKQFFLEVARVLKPRGIFVATDIIITPDLNKLPFPGFLIEASIQDGYGPWPDFWGEEQDHCSLAEQSGMECMQYADVTAETAPSHIFTMPAGVDLNRDPGEVAIRAAMTLAWLHRNGYLQYKYMVFGKSV